MHDWAFVGVLDNKVPGKPRRRQPGLPAVRHPPFDVSDDGSDFAEERSCASSGGGAGKDEDEQMGSQAVVPG